MSRIVKLIGIPLLALLVGWNLGVGYMQRELANRAPQTIDGGSGTIAVDPEKEADIGLLWDVWKLLLRHYIDPSQLGTDTLTAGAVEGLVRAVGDPYTVYMNEQEDEEFRDSLAGKLEGIGAELMLRDGLVTVVTPLKKSPAERAGVQAGDVIVEVDGNSTEGKSLTDTVRSIRGEKGTKVELTIVREKEAEPLRLSIVRDSIHVPSVEAKIISKEGKDIGHLSLNQFGEGSVAEARQELRAFQQKGVDAVILDLRSNGGGYLDGAVELASLFLKGGIVVTVEQRGSEPRSQSASGNPLLPDLPLVVLLNEASASASEIAAGALQDHGRAKILGKTSFGKGTVQEVIDLPGGGSLRVTVAKWKTPKGKDLSKEGVHPDFEVDRTADDIKAEKDPQLDAAVDYLLGKPVKTAGSSSSAR